MVRSALTLWDYVVNREILKGKRNPAPIAQPFLFPE